MTPARYQQIKQLLESALACAPGGRDQMLSEVCQNDPDLRLEVESLLDCHAAAADFIEEPAFETAARAMAAEDAAILNEHIGAYRIVREIGRGGMGAVYLAVRDDDEFQKQVAIKVVKRGMDSETVIRRFRNERQILATLDHPNIARLIDGGTTVDSLPYFVMEYVEGNPIDAYCEAGALSVEERLELFLSACLAVQFAHQNLVIHRDLKPSNILVTPEGVPKLLDFGIAKVLSPRPETEMSMTATGLRVLTPDYASPEQVRGERITTASDIYSLGVLLYEVLTGYRPYHFDSKAPFELARAITEIEPEKPSAAIGSRARKTEADDSAPKGGARPAPSAAISLDRLRRRLSGDLDNIVLMAMKKEPSRRYNSVAQFSEDIRRHLDGLPVVAHKDSLRYRTIKFITRNRTAVAATAAVALMLVAGIIITTWQAKVATRERDRARREQAKAERINQFLQDTLGSANPSWYSQNAGKGATATIGDVLGVASERAEIELADQPEILAAVLRTIGLTYQNISQLDVAERYLRSSLALGRKTYGADDSEVARSLAALGEVLTLKGNYDAAEPLFQESLAIYRRRPDDPNMPAWWVTATLGDLGLLKLTRGDVGGAEPFFREAMALYPKLAGNERAGFANILANLGRTREARGDLEEAESLYRQSIEEFRKLPGRRRLELGFSLSYLGDLLGTEGKYKEAESVLREALEVERQTVGDKNPYLCVTLNSLGYLLYLLGDYAEAEANVNHALDIFRQTVPEGHIGYAGPLTTLGLIMNKTGRSSQGEANIRKALSIRERILPKGHWQTAFTEGALGECLATQKRYAEAEPLLVESYQGLKAAQTEKNPRTIEARQRLEQFYHRKL